MWTPNSIQLSLQHSTARCPPIGDPTWRSVVGRLCTSGPSVVNVSQVVTLDKAALVERLGTLDGAQIRLVELGLRRVLNL